MKEASMAGAQRSKAQGETHKEDNAQEFGFIQAVQG